MITTIMIIIPWLIRGMVVEEAVEPTGMKAEVSEGVATCKCKKDDDDEDDDEDDEDGLR